MAAQPQAWEPAKVAQAVADARELVAALASDTGLAKSYAEMLGDLMTARLDGANDLDELRDRLAYVLYGFSIFGTAATAAAARAAGQDFEQAIKSVSVSVDEWLTANS
jgi:hypothetical protein